MNTPNIPIMDKSYPIDTLPLLSQDKSPHARAIRVCVLSGPDARLVRTFPLSTVQIGRAAKADFVLTDPTVSQFHLELSPYRSGVKVLDLKSRNGVTIAGVLVEKGIVPSGCQLQIGATEISVELEKPFPVLTAAVSHYGKLIGGSVSMRQLYAQLDRLAGTPLSVLIQGETGVGKELIAQALHGYSSCAQQAFVVLDCSTLQPELAASKLFGHEKGAFTGAQERRVGVFEAAHGGTVFLDEVGELSLELQKMLLRTLEANEVIPLGTHRPRSIHVRVLAASHRDLRAMVNRGQFREDLYYRLAQSSVYVPSLSERNEDIPALIQHFLAALPAEQKCARAIAPEALAMLQRRSFPGNVRELRNLTNTLAYLAEGQVITCNDIAAEKCPRDELAPSTHDLTCAQESLEFDSFHDFKAAKQRAVDAFERAFLRKLMCAKKTLSAAAELAGIERHSLRQLLKKHGLYVSTLAQE